MLMFNLHVGPNFTFGFFAVNSDSFKLFSKVMFQNFMSEYFFQCLLQNSLFFISYLLQTLSYDVHSRAKFL